MLTFMVSSVMSVLTQCGRDLRDVKVKNISASSVKVETSCSICLNPKQESINVTNIEIWSEIHSVENETYVTCKNNYCMKL